MSRSRPPSLIPNVRGREPRSRLGLREHHARLGSLVVGVVGATSLDHILGVRFAGSSLAPHARPTTQPSRVMRAVRLFAYANGTVCPY
jgi:hypothetical protein